jgi:PGF-CTERM protein
VSSEETACSLIYNRREFGFVVMIVVSDGAGRGVLFVFIVVVMLVPWAATGTAAAQSAPDCSTVTYDGDGTETNPYEVGNVDQLQCINEQDLGADYRQISDINASGTSGWNDGKGFEPIGEFNRTRDTEFTGFTGTFDGGNYTVSELTIDRGSITQVGLFEVVDSGRLEKVALENVNVTGDGDVGGLVGLSFGTVTNSYANGSVSGNSGVGGVVGNNFDGTVERSYATGNVSGTSNVGGLIGANGGTVTNSYATANVSGSGDLVGGLIGNSQGPVTNSYATGDITGNDRVGGLVGISGGIVERSYATGNVSGDDEVGGFVGRNGGNVTDSYATGNVSGDEEVGGLVGSNFDGTVTESYWDTETTGQSTSAGGTGLNKSEMTGDDAARNMQGFNFMTTWETVSGEYPTLNRQSDGGEDRSSDSTGSNNDGESDSSDGAEGEGLPGFTVVTAMLALLTVVAAAIRWRGE